MSRIFLIFGLLLLCLSSEVHAQTGNPGNIVYREFAKTITGYGSKIYSYAERLFWSLAALSLAWTGVTLILRKADLMDFAAELVRFIVTTGFFFWLLQNSSAIAGSLITSLQEAGKEVSGSSGAGGMTAIMEVAMNFSSNAMMNLSIFEPSMAVLWSLIAIIVIIVACYVVVNVTIAACSALMLVYAGIFVLGFGGSRWTSEMAINYYKSVLAAGLRLFTLNLLVATAVKVVNNAFTGDVTSVQNAFTCMAVLIIVAMLIDKVPATIANLVSANHVGAAGSAMGSLVGATSLAAQGIVAVATGGTSLVAGGAVKAASTRATAAMTK